MEASQKIDESLWDNEPREVTYLKTENGQEVEVGVLAYDAPIYADKHGWVFVPFVDYRAIDFIAAQSKEMIVDGFDCVIMITGRRRIGKSNLGLQIARKVDSAFTLDSVAFHIEEFADLLEKNPFAVPESNIFPQAFYDEAGYGLFAKDWMVQWVKEVGKCMQVVGRKRNIVYFILPHIKKLIGDIRDEMAYIWIDLDFKFKHKRGYAEVYTGVRNKHKQLIWWNPKCCFKYPELTGDFWTQYEARKDNFIKDISTRRSVKGGGSKDSERLDLILHTYHKQGLTFLEIGKKIGMSESQVCRRVKDFQSVMNRQGPLEL